MGKNSIFKLVVFCQKAGFVSPRHNLLRNITSSLINDAFKCVRTESHLQLLNGTTLNNYNNGSATIGNERRLDLYTCGFRQAVQINFFYVRLFNLDPKEYA